MAFTLFAADCIIGRNLVVTFALLLPASFEEIWWWHLIADTYIIWWNLVVAFVVLLPTSFEEIWWWHLIWCYLHHLKKSGGDICCAVACIIEEIWWWHLLCCCFHHLKKSGGGICFAATCIIWRNLVVEFAMLLPASSKRSGCFAATYIIWRNLLVTFAVLLPASSQEIWWRGWPDTWRAYMINNGVTTRMARTTGGVTTQE